MTGALDLSWAAALRRLRMFCPTDRPVRVRLMRMSGDAHGTCEQREKLYLLDIERTLTESHRLMVLSHEWAHAMAWPLELAWGPEHTAHFGICYVRAYNAIFDPGVL